MFMKTVLALLLLASLCGVADSQSARSYSTGKPSINLGVAPYTYKDLTVDQMLERIRDLDVRFMGVKTFMVKDGVMPGKTQLVDAITDEEIAAFKKKLADSGVSISSVGPVYMTTEAQCESAFRFAKRLGADVLVAVPSERVPDTKAKKKGKKKNVANRKMCEIASACCAKYDIKCAIHNHGPDMPDCYPSAESAYDMIKDLDPRMGLCLDVGHDFRAGFDPAETIRRYRKRIFHVHVKNVDPDVVDVKTGRRIKRNQSRPFPRGKIDLVEVINALAEIGYSGTCEIEYERDFDDNTSAMHENVGYFRGVLDSVR